MNRLTNNRALTDKILAKELLKTVVEDAYTKDELVDFFVRIVESAMIKGITTTEVLAEQATAVILRGKVVQKNGYDVEIPDNGLKIEVKTFGQKPGVEGKTSPRRAYAPLTASKHESDYIVALVTRNLPAVDGESDLIIYTIPTDELIAEDGSLLRSLNFKYDEDGYPDPTCPFKNYIVPSLGDIYDAVMNNPIKRVMTECFSGKLWVPLPKSTPDYSMAVYTDADPSLFV